MLRQAIYYFWGIGEMMERLEPNKGWLKALLVAMGIGLFVQLAGSTFNSDGSRYATQVHLLLLLPALLLLLCQKAAPCFWRQPAAILLLLLMSWVCLAAVFNPGSARTPGHWLMVVLKIGLYVFAVASLSRHERRFTWVILAAVVVVVAFAWLTLYYQFGVLDQPLSYPAVRWKSRLRELGWHGYAAFGHPIFAGQYYGVFAILLTWLFIRAKGAVWQSALFALGMVGLLAYVLLTFSRGAWFSVMASGLLLLLLFSSARSRTLLGLAVLAFSVATVLFWSEIRSEQRIGVSSRDLIWHDWWARVPEFWLQGAGAGAKFIFKFRHGLIVEHAHSLYLQLWYQYGIVGITLFVSLLGALLWKGWTCRAEPMARLGLVLLVFAMVAMVSDVYDIFVRPNMYWVMFWLPVGILLGVRKPGSGASGESAAG